VDEVELTGLTMDVLDVRGGSSNSIHLSNCKIEDKIVAKKDQSGANAVAPRIFLKGSTTVPKIEVATPAIIEAESTVPQIANIIANAATTIQGAIKVAIVSIYTTGSDTAAISVEVKGGTVAQVTADDDAVITVNAGATVTTVTANDVVTVAGEGTIENVVIPEDATDVKVTIAAGATVGNLEVNAEVEVENNGTVSATSTSQETMPEVTTSGTNADALDAALDAAHVHVWDEGVVTTAATCTEAGVMTYTCSAENCTYENGQKTEPISALGHAYDEGVVTKEPTATEPGVKTFTCANDSTHTYTEEIPALGEDNTETPTEPEEPEEPETVLATLTTSIQNGILTLTNTLSDATNALYKFVRGSASGTAAVDGFSTYVANLPDYANLGGHTVETYTTSDDTWTLLDPSVPGIYKNADDTVYYVADLTSDPYTISTDTTTLTISAVDSEGTALSEELVLALVVKSQIAAFETTGTPTISYNSVDNTISVNGLTANSDYVVLIKQDGKVSAVASKATASGWSAALPTGVDTTKAASVYIVKITDYVAGTTGSSVNFTATGLGRWITAISGWGTSSI
jgi:hypothetical protein